MSMLRDFQGYTDLTGMVSEYCGAISPSGNAIVITAESVRVLMQHGYWSTSYSYSRAIDTNCWLEPGLPRRCRWHEKNGYSTDQLEYDDMVGLLYLYYVTGRPQKVLELLKYGETHFYVPFKRLPWLKFKGYYGNEFRDRSDDARAWLWRFPQLKAQMQVATYIRPSWWRRAVWALALATSGLTKPENAYDVWRLPALMIEMTPKDCRMLEWGKRVYLARRKHYFPGGMKQINGEYYAPKQTDGRVHPNSVYCRD